jgi:hypothetical protein
MWSMAFTAPIFMKLGIRKGISVDMFCTELYSNWTKLENGKILTALIFTMPLLNDIT